MIKDLHKNDNFIAWTTNEVEHRLIINDKSYIYNENFILIMNEQRDNVKVLDEYGRIIFELLNSNDLCLMYLQEHPKFGLTAVASVKNKDGKWADKYLAWIDNKFEIVSNSR